MHPIGRQALSKIDEHIKRREEQLLNGAFPATTMEEGWANYLSGKILRKELQAIRQELAELFKDEADGDEE